MPNVTLNLDESTLNTLYDRLSQRKQALLDELDRINNDLDAIGAALRQEQETLVMSEHQPWTSYLVTYRKDGSYGCSCKSFEFKSGLDEWGRCKHIRKAISEGRWVNK